MGDNDVMALRFEPYDEMRAEKAAAAGDERTHRVRVPPSSLSPRRTQVNPVRIIACSMHRGRQGADRSSFGLWFAALILLGVVGRVAFYTSPFGVPDSDEAIGGLMAKDALGGHFTTFFWGQAYGGPLETWLAAPVSRGCSVRHGSACG